MRSIVLVLSSSLLACGARGPAPAPPPAANPVTLAIVGATVVHPAGAADPDQTILITGDRITRVGPAASVVVPPGTATVDGRNRWVIPGLIDSHVHFFQSGNPFTRPDAADFTSTVPYADEVARNKARLPATI